LSQIVLTSSVRVRPNQGVWELRDLAPARLSPPLRRSRRGNSSRCISTRAAQLAVICVWGKGSAARPGYAKYRGPVRLPDGSIAIKQTETRIGPAWTGTGRPPARTYTRRTAQAWLDAKLTDLRRGIGIASIGDNVTFADVAVEWYRRGCYERAWKPATRRDYRSALRAHLGVDLDPVTGAVVATRPPFGEMRIEDITTDTIERWRASAMEPYRHENGVQRIKLPRRTAVKVVAILHGIFARARKPPFNLTNNPAADVERLRDRYDSGRFEFYSVEEVMALVRATENEPDESKEQAAKQDGAIFLTAALTGLRQEGVRGCTGRLEDARRGRTTARLERWAFATQVSAKQLDAPLDAESADPVRGCLAVARRTARGQPGGRQWMQYARLRNPLASATSCAAWLGRLANAWRSFAVAAFAPAIAALTCALVATTVDRFPVLVLTFK
jgi:integrase